MNGLAVTLEVLHWTCARGSLRVQEQIGNGRGNA